VLIQLDMSEYMEKFNVSRLVGSPPATSALQEGASVTEQVTPEALSVVLFDEIEKAHPDVWNMLLQILEDGKLTDTSCASSISETPSPDDLQRRLGDHQTQVKSRLLTHYGRRQLRKDA